MKVGIIGAGKIAKAVASQFLRINVPVALSNGKGPESLADTVRELGSLAEATTVKEASSRDIIVLSVPWSKIPKALEQASINKGAIVIDTTNPIEGPAFIPFDLKGKTSSEVISEMVPNAKVVKVMNTLQPHALAANPIESGKRRVLFMSGDFDDAKKKVKSLLSEMGFSVIDLGSLKEGGKLQQFPGGPFPALNLWQA